MSVRFRVATVVSTAILAVGVGVAVAAPAFAVNDQVLCVNVGNPNKCANVSSGNNGTAVAMNTAGTSTWDVPGGRTGQISSYQHSGKCMTIDHGGTLHNTGNPIWLQSCAAGEYQEWDAKTWKSATGFTWDYYQNPHTGLCLNDDVNTGWLNAAPCNATSGNPNQLFYPETA